MEHTNLRYRTFSSVADRAQISGEPTPLGKMYPAGSVRGRTMTSVIFQRTDTVVEFFIKGNTMHACNCTLGQSFADSRC